VERNTRQQAWYVARHLKLLSGNLARLGFSEASLLVGAAAISVGDQVVKAGSQSFPASSLNGKVSFRQGTAVHG